MEKVQRCNCIKMGINSPSPSYRSRGEVPREEAMLWLRHGREKEALEASAAWAPERATTSATRGRGG